MRKGNRMPAVTSLKEELNSLGQAAQAGVISQEEAIGAAQELIMQAQQGQMMAPSVPRALDPALDSVIAKPYEGPDGFGGAVGGGLQEGAKMAIGAFFAKAGLEHLVPMLYNHGTTSRESGDFIKTIKNFDISTLPEDARAPMQAAKKYLKSWQNHEEMGNQAVEALRGARSAMEQVVSGSLVNVSSDGAGVSAIAADVTKAAGTIAVQHQDALNQMATAAGTVSDSASLNLFSTLQHAENAIENIAATELKNITGHSNTIHDLGKEIVDQASKGAASHDAIGVLNKAEKAVEHRLGQSFQLNGTARNLLIGTVAATALVGAYKGYRSAEEARHTHEELQRTTAGTREDYAQLYNQASDMAAVINQPTRASVINAPYAVVPSAVITEPAAQGQGMPIMAPASAASRAEMLDYQRQLAASQAGGAPVMN